MKIGVILSGSGVYDGSEIHEAVFTLLAIDRQGAESVLFAPNKNQHHVINHLDGSEMQESRNVLIEAARIARGSIQDLKEIDLSHLDALVIPGGFGAAKNLNTWALFGPESTIDEDVQKAILDAIHRKIPIAALCMGPTVIAKALEGSSIKATVTVGTTESSSPYDIKGISEGINKVGSNAVMKTVHQIAVDSENRIISAPCYMMDGSISDIHNNIEEAIEKLFEFLQ